MSYNRIRKPRANLVDRACWAIYWATVAGIVIYLAVTTFWKGV